MTAYINGYCASDASRFLPPLWYQEPFLDSDARIRILQMGRGTGKSESIWQAMQDMSIDYPFSTLLFGAPSHKILSDGIFKTIALWRRVVEQEPREDGGGGWGFDPIAEMTTSPQKMRLVFDWGSEIVFRSTKDMDDFRGMNCSGAVFDEADYIEASEDQWAAFVPTLRGFGPHRIVAAGTPSDNGSGLLALLLHLAQKDPDVEVFRATTLDNPFFPAHTLRLMRATMSSDCWAREVEGRPVARSGLVFPEYTDANIIDGFDLVAQIRQEQWNPMLTPIQRWRTFWVFDWGFTMSHALQIAARQITEENPPEAVIIRDIPFDRHDGAEMVKTCLRLSSTDPIRPTAAVYDPEGPVSIASALPILHSEGIPAVCQRLAQFRRAERTVELVRRMICTQSGVRSLKVTRQVANSEANYPGGRGVHQGFLTYSLSEVRRGSGVYSDKPWDDNKVAHGMDCVRYWCMNMGKFGYRLPFREINESEVRALDIGQRAQRSLA